MSYHKETELLLNTIKVSTSPFHAVREGERQLREAGYEELKLGSLWKLSAGHGYYINAFGSTLLGFFIHDTFPEAPVCRIAAAHTDWPCLRVKPSPEVKAGKYGKVNVEVYGGPILSTWFDRPLSLSGRITLYSQFPDSPKVELIDFKRTLLTIPNLAIHLNRDVNKGIEINPQVDTLPILTLLSDTLDEDQYFMKMLAEEAGVEAEDILDYELYIYNREDGELWGKEKEFISAPRIDNLSSVQACLTGLIEAKHRKGLNLIALFDNEEIGSCTKQGADSSLLEHILELIFLSFGLDRQVFLNSMFQSMLLSIDVAHAIHPNKPEKTDITNKIYLNDGYAIKMNCRQAYATDSSAIAVIEGISRHEGIPYKKFANRSDITGGGTLGSIASARLSMKAVDVGIPVLAMHSARETMGEADQRALTRLVRCYFSM